MPMSRSVPAAWQAIALAAFAASGIAGGARAASSGASFTVTANAEVEIPTTVRGRETVKLEPALRVVPGDEVIYTLEIRNPGALPLPPPRVDFPVPEHLRYVEDSAVGPGAQVSYSVDGGQTFGAPESLQVIGPDGRKRPATAADYTHIRWQLKHTLRAHAVAFAHFRAIVK